MLNIVWRFMPQVAERITRQIILSKCVQPSRTAERCSSAAQPESFAGRHTHNPCPPVAACQTRSLKGALERVREKIMRRGGDCGQSRGRQRLPKVQPRSSSHTISCCQDVIMHSSHTGWSSSAGSHSVIWRRAQRWAGGQLSHTAQSSSGTGMAAACSQKVANRRPEEGLSMKGLWSISGDK
jgi:hypothetical protein